MQTATPRHFHLLWDEDIDQLRGIFKLIFERSEEIVRHWYRLYVLHFGDARSLSESEFIRIFEPALRRNKRALLQGDLDAYAAQVMRMGELLAQRRVPLEEIIASLHLFEESVYTVFPSGAPTRIYTSFDKLSHVRIILLVSAYFRSHSAAAGERIAALEREAARLANDSRSRFHGLVGASRAMRRVYAQIQAAGARHDPVLIVGEPGTGRDQVARAIHEISAARAGPFAAINCAAVPPDLIAGELFGFTRGAQNGAAADYLGLLRAAEDGSVFIQEAAALEPPLQAELLRVIREKTVRPAGPHREYPVNVRFLASIAGPGLEAAQDRLNSALLKALRSSAITVPALRDRREDIALLADHFISVLRERSGRPVYGLSPQALSALREYDWPGHVRELSDVIETAFEAAKGNVIDLAELPALGGTPPPTSRRDIPKPSLPLASFAEHERELIERALRSTGGNKVQTARLLHISRKRLYARIRKFGLQQTS